MHISVHKEYNEEWILLPVALAPALAALEFY